MILIKNWNSMTFHDHFCDLSISHDFQGLENENSMTFQVFHDLYEACHSLVQTHILLGLPMNQAPLIWIVLTLASTFLSTLFIAWRIVCTSFPPMPLLELWWPSALFSWVCLSCLHFFSADHGCRIVCFWQFHFLCIGVFSQPVYTFLLFILNGVILIFLLLIFHTLLAASLVFGKISQNFVNLLARNQSTCVHSSAI